MLAYAQDADSPPIIVSKGGIACPPPVGFADLQSELPSNGTEVSIASVSFSGFLQMPVAEQEQIAATIKQQKYVGASVDQVKEEAEERVRAGWQNHGYFKVLVTSNCHVLSSSAANEQIALSFHVDEGPKYRLGQMAFRNNMAVSNLKALRTLFPINDGDVFSRERVAKGLENLRKAYGQLGYINFTSVPETTFNDDNQTVALSIDIDEGKQFHVSSLHVIGAPREVLNDLALKPGKIYNVRLVDMFLQKHLPRAYADDPHVVEKSLDEQAGTVAVTFDFRTCPTQ